MGTFISWWWMRFSTREKKSIQKLSTAIENSMNYAQMWMICTRYLCDLRSNARARTPSATGSAQSAEKNEIERFSALRMSFFHVKSPAAAISVLSKSFHFALNIIQNANLAVTVRHSRAERHLLEEKNETHRLPRALLSRRAFIKVMPKTKQKVLLFRGRWRWRHRPYSFWCEVFFHHFNVIKSFTFSWMVDMV